VCFNVYFVALYVGSKKYFVLLQRRVCCYKAWNQANQRKFFTLNTARKYTWLLYERTYSILHYNSAKDFDIDTNGDIKRHAVVKEKKKRDI